MELNANGTKIEVVGDVINEDAYISLTDIARYKNPKAPADVIKNWMRLRGTIEYLGLWEQLNNPDFKLVEFELFKNNSGGNAFTLSPQQWVKTTNAIGITSKSGRYGGTYAHSDIAFEFASWISPEFKLYIIKDYQRLKIDESKRNELGWDTKRELSRINYRIHTDAIKEFIITPELTKQEISHTYANEADILNMALFGMTAKEWRAKTGEKRKNMRDFASIDQLIVLVNLESMNADMIRQGLDKKTRLKKLRSVAYYQLKSLERSNASEKLANKVAGRIARKDEDK